MRETTSTGPAPFPRSSARLKKAKAVPLVSGRQTFLGSRERERERERGRREIGHMKEKRRGER